MTIDRPAFETTRLLAILRVMAGEVTDMAENCEASASLAVEENNALQARVAELRQQIKIPALAKVTNERDSARAKIAELQAQLDRAKKDSEYFVSKMCDLLGIPDSCNESGIYLAANELKEKLDRATKPRPMSEAPRDGTEIIVHCRARCGKDGRVVQLHQAHGWLPATDETKEDDQ